MKAQSAGFDWEVVETKSIVIEAFLIFRLTRRQMPDRPAALVEHAEERLSLIE